MKGQIIDNIKKIKIITQKVLGHIEVEAVSEEVEAVDNKIMMVFKEMKKLLDNSHQKTFNLIIKKMLGEEEIIIANTSKKVNLKMMMIKKQRKDKAAKMKKIDIRIDEIQSLNYNII